MASVQEAGMVRLYRRSPNGNKTLIAQMRVEDSAPAGGAPDAAGASVATPEKRFTINSPVELVNDDILEVTFESDAGDTLDASDCVWSIPLVTSSGTKTLGRANFANPTLGDDAMVANTEAVIAGYKVVEGRARVAGKIYLDIQDDS